jgi:C4-dicarboxylate-specific signal transduction histidine kinase
MRHAMLGLMSLMFLIVMVLATVISLRWARSVFQPVERMRHTLQQVADGQTDARVGPVVSTDELGELSRYLDHLLNVIAEKTAVLHRWGTELDERVRERTAELEASHRSLQQTQQHLVRSEKLAVMGQLAVSVAHEVNNPIAIMQGNLDLMRATLGPQALPIQMEFNLLDEQIERIRMIVQQLLQHARPDEYAGCTETVDGNEALRASLVLLKHALTQASVHVTLDLQATHSVVINHQELRQVHLNLLMNALHAMPQGGTLTLSSRNTCNCAGWVDGVELRIQDTGPGMTEHVHQHLFRAFFTTRPEGHGLGLWISQTLIERYRGRITAHNVAKSEGGGAAFCVWLPVESPDQRSDSWAAVP